MDKYLLFNDFIKNASLSQDKNTELLENEQLIMTSNLQKVYQVNGIYDQGKAYIRHVGNFEKKPKILLNKFKFQDFDCNILSYVLDQKDIVKSNNTKLFKMVSLIMFKNEKPIVSICMKYKLSNDDIPISELLSDENNIIATSGSFLVYLKKYINNEKILLHTFQTFPGNNNIIEKLIKFLTNKELNYLY